VTIKNISGGVLTVKGQRLQDNEEYTLTSEEVSLWDTDDFGALIDGGDLEIVRNTAGKFWRKSITESTTTSTNWQRKLRLNMDITASGTYRMAWTGDISSSANNQEVASRVQLDDSTPNFDFNQSKGKDIVSVAGFHYAPLSSGSHTLDLDWKAVAGGTAKIEKVRLEYWAESVEREET
jgi:hypothetical protein